MITIHRFKKVKAEVTFNPVLFFQLSLLWVSGFYQFRQINESMDTNYNKEKE